MDGGRYFRTTHLVPLNITFKYINVSLNSIWSFEDPVKDEAPTKDSSASAAPVVSEQPSATEVTPLTIGEMVEKHLNTHRIGKKSRKDTAGVSHKCLHVGINVTPFLGLSFSVPQVTNPLLTKSRFPLKSFVWSSTVFTHVKFLMLSIKLWGRRFPSAFAIKWLINMSD